MELRPLRKIQRTELDDTVLLRTVRDMDSLVDRESVDLPVLVVNVGALSGEILYGQNTSPSGDLWYNDS